MTTESFGQLVIQTILILRFKWLVDKVELSSFGISFKTYVIITMIISLISMIHGILRYHNRRRESLRPMFNVGNLLLLLMWSSILLTKLSVYVVGFLNTPGLIFLPILLHLVISLTVLQKYVPQFQDLEKHEKLVHVLVAFLVPVSLPSEQTKTMKTVYGLSSLLFFLESLSIIAFASLAKNFYPNNGFRTSSNEFPKLIKLTNIVEDFDQLCVLMASLVVTVTVVSVLVLAVYTKCAHPRNNLYQDKKTKTDTESHQDRISSGEGVQNTEDNASPTCSICLICIDMFRK